jgi:flagellum-specific peptidoglycan hydrolase FlgJ
MGITNAVDDILGVDNSANTPQQSPSANGVDEILGLNTADTNPGTSPGGLPSITNQADPWEDFKQKAQNVVAARGLPSRVIPVLLGQASLESARGKAAPGNNYFGIKGQGTAGSNNLATQEYGNGGYYGENSDFAAYNNPEDSINAYLDLILKYHGVPEAIASGQPMDILNAIKANGYATSPTYVENVANTPEFKQFSNQ